jgi:hypothetical protein
LNLVEQICAVPGNEAAPEMLDMLPQDLRPIELRRCSGAHRTPLAFFAASDPGSTAAFLAPAPVGLSAEFNNTEADMDNLQCHTSKKAALA